MGWFNTDIENVLYSDETLDLAFSFLNDFSAIYKNNLGRKPTVEELEYLLKLSFRVNADDMVLDDFEDKKIEEVKFKLGKRKKKLKYEVGDMCTIPLRCGGYAFSRILILQPPSWYLSEIFAYYSKDKSYHPNIDSSGYLLYPMFITPNDYNNWQSDIIHHIKGYISPHYDELRYYYGYEGHYQLTKVGENYGQHITDEEAKKYMKQVFYHPADILNMIENELKKRTLIF
jgi:hypothetical protein